MEDIKVGDYVRTRSGKIDIFKEKDENYLFARCEKNTYWIPDIVKHSKNIIDLIKVGDIVHIKDVLHEDITYIWSEDYLKALKEDLSNGIKLVEILTHEQFESIEYKVEEDK